MNAQGSNEFYRIQFLTPEQKALSADFSFNTYKNLYDSTSVISLVKKAISELQKDGYLAASADSIIFRETFALVYIETGSRYKWRNLTSHGIPPQIIRKNDLNRLQRRHQFISTENTFQLFDRILQGYENLGYPFARISFENVNFDEHFVDANLKVIKHNRITIDSIIIRGDIRLSRNFIYRQASIYKGSLYNQAKIINLGRTLHGLPFLTFVQEPGVEFKSNSAVLYLFMNRQNANRFQGMMGFQSDHRQSGKLVLTGDIQLELMNSFARGEVLGLNWKKTDINNQELDLALKWPFLFGSPIGADVSFHLFRFDTLYMNTDFRLAVRFSLGEAGWLSAFYANKSSTTIGDVSTINLGGSNTRLYGLGYEFSSLDNFFNPQSGWTVNATLAFGERAQTTQAVQNLVSNRFDFNMKAGYFIPLIGNSALMLMTRTGNISLFEEGRRIPLFDNELYRLGGINNIRGFDENSLLSSFFTSLSLEYRWLFDRYSNLFIFTDLMYYSKNTITDSESDIPVGIGAGLNLQTRAGMFSISYALGSQKGNPLELKSAKVHIGYISRF